MIETRNPFAGMPAYPDARPDRFFMAELDVLWDANPAEAQRILDEFKALGGNHIMTGPARANGYHFHFPDTNWFGRAAKFVAFLQWLHDEGILVSLVVMTDIPPYYDGAKMFDWSAIARDFDPFYAELRRLKAPIPRVVSQWEQYQDRATAAQLFAWMAQQFPDAKRYWHNSVQPPHLSPGASDEEERETWESACRYLHGMYLQADHDMHYSVNADGRTPQGQMRYDLWDMHRRAHGVNSPWGGPILNVAGEPFEVVFCEGTAYPMYWLYATQTLAAEWAREALSVEGITECLDGVPL